MSLSLETINKGEVENFGYSFGGVQRVLLGELQPMPTPQFCELAGVAMIEIASILERHTDEQTWESIGRSLQMAFYRDQITKVDRQNFLDFPEYLPINQVDSNDLSADSLGMMLNTISLTPDLVERLEQADEEEQRRIYNSLIANLIIQNGWTATPYEETPFTVNENSVDIGGEYEVAFSEFGLFVGQILAGGLFGWDMEVGMPKEAKETISKLRQIWQVNYE